MNLKEIISLFIFIAGINLFTIGYFVETMHQPIGWIIGVVFIIGGGLMLLMCEPSQRTGENKNV